MANSSVSLLEKFSSHPFIAMLSLLSLLIILYKWRYTKINTLPSPPKMPLIGNLHQLGTLPHRTLRSLSQRYGDLMLLHLGSKPTLIISSATTAEEIMKTHDIVFANRPQSRVACTIFYNCIDMAFSKYGDYFKRIKSICVMNMLSNKKVQSFRKIREEEVALAVENIKKSTPYKPVNLSEVFTRITNDVVCRVAFGRKYAGEEGCANMKELMNDLSVSLGTFTVGDFIPWLLWIDHVTGVLQKARKVADTFDNFMEKVVQEHQDRWKDEDEKEDQDLADVLLEIQRNDASLERNSIKALLVDMLIAGIETVYTTLEWTMSELLLSPQTMSKLQEEVRGIAKEKARIDEDDLKNMSYLKAVIKETLRLHPPLPLLLFREASQDVKVSGYDILAGTHVIVNGWAIQRHPSSWDQPEVFRPERFLKSTLDFKGHGFEYIPFGAGRRSCPGMSFGIVNAELVLANLVGEFNWELPQEVDIKSFMTETFGVSVHRRHPLLAIPNPYSLI